MTQLLTQKKKQRDILAIYDRQVDAVYRVCYAFMKNIMSTASLGAYFDPSYDGDGLLIAEVIARGPLSTKAADIAAGDIIMSIDGTPVLKDMDYFPLLEGKSGKKTRLGIRKASGEEKSVEIKPISQGRLGSLIYDRWVERNEAFVDSISGGRIGYVHIQGMDSPSFRTIYDRLLGKYRTCDAVVVDTRYGVNH